MKKYLIFSIIADILLIVLFLKYIFISNISIIPTFLFVFSLFMGILYGCCKDDTLSFHIAPYTDEKNGTTNRQVPEKHSQLNVIMLKNSGVFQLFSQQQYFIIGTHFAFSCGSTEINSFNTCRAVSMLSVIGTEIWNV